MSGHTDWPTHAEPVRRWIDLPTPEATPEYAVDEGDLDAVMDELRRHAGEQIWVHEA
jgi:hypothetical protein